MKPCLISSDGYSESILKWKVATTPDAVADIIADYYINILNAPVMMKTIRIDDVRNKVTFIYKGCCDELEKGECSIIPVEIH